MHQHTITSKKFFWPPLSLMILFSITVIVFTSCGPGAATEKYGFVALLGNDTVSVESVTRQGNTLTSDEVDRFPRVRVRHTVVNLNDDGSIKHLVMEIHTPSEPTTERERKVVANVSSDEVHLSKTDSTGTVNRNFATGGSIVVAHVPQMYSLYELYFAAAMKKAATAKLATGTPVQMRQFYIDREFDNFPLGHATVTLLSNGKAEIFHDWLAGIGEAVLDSNYHLLRYSGERTTYKVNVNRLDSAPDIKTIAERFEANETKSGAVQSLSVRDTVTAQIGMATFTIDYGRPLQRGRRLLGGVIPYDQVWRTGANAATQFTTSAPIKIGSLSMPAGKYTLWTAPHTSGVDLIINKQTGQWGTGYKKVYDLGTTRFATDSLAMPVETFTVAIVPGTDKHHGTLVMEWGSFRWSAAIEVE